MKMRLTGSVFIAASMLIAGCSHAPYHHDHLVADTPGHAAANGQAGQGRASASQPSPASVQIKVGYHATQGVPTPNFAFADVPTPSRNDAATTAKFTVVAGEKDTGSGGLEALHDGAVPSEEDQPDENFFFTGKGGRLEVDLGSIRKLKQVNTYSWHPSSRGPQVYTLYASDGTATAFADAPKDTNPETCGWKRIAQVDTRNIQTPDGGQHGVSISGSAGTLGKYRYLLFDISPTESQDPFGNTFYSEIDVVERNGPTQLPATVPPSPFVVRSSDGKCLISIDTAKAPELTQWAQESLAPALIEWYPRIVALMTSKGFAAPEKFSISIRPMSGVAFTNDTRISASAQWLKGELKREAIGAVVHEVVHVVQQYHPGNHTDAPNWLVEGIPDYIRFFKYEPQAHGADIVYLKSRHNENINYDGLYRISANFLNYVITHYDADGRMLAKVNGACRDGTYTDALWEQLTGKPLSQLNEEWKQAVREDTAR